jgi:hypothetical protein
MDILISLHGILSLFMFIVLQILVFRRIRDREVMKWLAYIYLIIGVCHFAGAVLYWKFFLHGQPGITTVFEYACVSFLIFSMLVVSYVNAVFGITMTSLRIQILTEIMGYGKAGISGKTIARIYSKEVIIRKRLDRLMASGDLQFTGGYYRPKSHMSFFIIHTYFLTVINRLYHKPVYRIE